MSADALEEKFDAIIVDEAQDFSDDYWLGVEMVFRDTTDGYLYIFIDENQALYPRRSKLPIEDEPYYLTNNCRNTVPIHNAAYCYYEGSPIDPPELLGHDVIWSSADKAEGQADAVLRRVHQWVHVEGIKPSDVTILVAKRPKNQQYDLLRKKATAEDITLEFEVMGKGPSVLVDTVARFKGLESQAVVLWLGDEVVEEQHWETVYVGTTRAKTLLAVVASPSAIRTLRDSCK